ncbi:hypothetical protein AB1M95_16105 [Sulfitobacter sp. LCG007]
MNFRPKLLFVAAAIAGLFASAASSATYRMSYEFGTGVLLQSVVNGKLQSDGDTVDVGRVVNFWINGVTQPVVSFGSATSLIASVTAPPVLSFSGTGLDFWICSSVNCGSGMALLEGHPPLPDVAILGGDLEAYDSSRYSLTAVPLPASALLMAPVLGILAFGRRRKAVA